MYADYAYYRAEYGGGQVPEDAYPFIGRQASRVLDALTFGRIYGPYAASDEVRMACCAVAEVLYDARESGGREVARERLDAMEVAYAAGAPGIHRQCLDAARLYLWRTGLLSLCVRRAERC